MVAVQPPTECQPDGGFGEAVVDKPTPSSIKTLALPKRIVNGTAMLAGQGWVKEQLCAMIGAEIVVIIAAWLTLYCYGLCHKSSSLLAQSL
jgi:hypothetical protein